MSYRVIWKHLVTRQLAAYYLTALEKGSEEANRVTEAVAEIDRLLASNPQEVGESRPDFERVLPVLPLVATYEVYEEEHIVYVLRIRYAPRRTSDN